MVGAIREYLHATKSSLRESAAAVTATRGFPKPAPEPGWSAPAPPARTGVPAGYRYRAIVSRGEEVREVASTRLNEDIFQQIRSLALGGNYDDAAALLRRHADIAEDQAREFVSMIGPEESPPGAAAVQRVLNTPVPDPGRGRALALGGTYRDAGDTASKVKPSW